MFPRFSSSYNGICNELISSYFFIAEADIYQKVVLMSAFAILDVCFVWILYMHKIESMPL